MPAKFVLVFTSVAASHLRAFTKFEQRLIVEAIEQQLPYEPTQETRNKKPLRDNMISDWELRVGKYRVFYDVIFEEPPKVVKVKGIGCKEHNILYLGGKEVQL